MLIVFQCTAADGTRITLYHGGYVTIEPSETHIGYQFTAEDAEEFVAALREVFGG